MTSTYRYLDISSDFRNRNRYPNPSDFVMKCSASYANGVSALQTTDPVLGAYPSLTGTTFTIQSSPPLVTLSTGSTTDNYYVNQYVQQGSEYRIITSYSGATLAANLNAPFTATSTGPFTIRRTPPLLTSLLPAPTVPPESQRIINIGPAGYTPVLYTGNFLYFSSGANTNAFSQIISYTGAITTATIAYPMTGTIAASDGYEILGYSGDNEYPLIYPAMTLGQPVCYAIELLYLILPNVTLKCGHGGTFNDYPYFYVKLYNEGNQHTGQTLYSNNPNSQTALFKVPIGLNLTTERFFTLKEAKQIQVVKFKPDQPLRFTVTLPTGEPIVFDKADDMSPYPPNPFLQISASFAFRRLDGDLNGRL